MRVCVTLGFLLVGAILGLLVEGIDDDRFQRENAVMSKSPRIHHDNNKLVKMTMRKRSESLWRVPTDDITFRLYTKKNPKAGQYLLVDDTKKLKNSNFNASKPTRFVTHGWLGDGSSPSCTLIRDAYLSRSDCNLIIVDWSECVKLTLYTLFAHTVTDSVGKTVAKMINFLLERGNLTTETTTLIGYSVGAHIMGVAGYNTENKVNNVVGLDPALHTFFFSGPADSISTESGDHVQIIHTNGGILGRLSSIGHADFFPNGGTHQPSCIMIGCSHKRAYELFAASIEKPINGTRCNSYFNFIRGNCGNRARVAQMGGLNLESVQPGNYYLQTGSTAPYFEL